MNWKQIFWLCSLPFVVLVFNMLGNNLGANPVENIILETGVWSLNFLIITLSCTPLQRWAKIRILPFRKQFGLWTAFYGFLHMLTIVYLEYGFDWAHILKDTISKPFYLFGWISAIILAVLTLTSNKFSIRKLGPVVWRKVHWWVYIALASAIIHFYLKVKVVEIDLKAYILVAFFLLFYRLKKWWNNFY